MLKSKKTVCVIFIGIAINLLMNIEIAIDTTAGIERIEDSHLICKRITLVNDEGKQTAMFDGGGYRNEAQLLLFGRSSGADMYIEVDGIIITHQNGSSLTVELEGSMPKIHLRDSIRGDIVIDGYGIAKYDANMNLISRIMDDKGDKEAAPKDD